MVVACLPPQTGFPPPFSAAREPQPTARELATAVTHKQLVQPSSELTFSPCRSLTIFDLGIEFTEYKCQSVGVGGWVSGWVWVGGGCVGVCVCVSCALLLGCLSQVTKICFITIVYTTSAKSSQQHSHWQLQRLQTDGRPFSKPKLHRHDGHAQLPPHG